MVRVAFLIRALVYGGAERQLVNLVCGLDRKMFEPVVLVFYGGAPLEGELIRKGIRVVSLGKKGRWDLWGFLWRLIRVLRELQPDILHSYLVDSNNITALVKPLFPRMRVVWGVRASNMDMAQYDLVARLSFLLSRFLARRADLIVVNSYAGRDYHAARGYPAEKMVVVPNGIDTHRFYPDRALGVHVREEWGVPRDVPLIGLVGRLDPMKGHPTFLRAASLLARKQDYVRFVCVGEGPEAYSRELHSLARELGLDGRLIWANARGDMPGVYNALDIASSSSYGEGFPNVIGEAMACGVPCVVTDVGDSAWLLDGAGRVVPPGDPQALAEAWTDLLSLPVAERLAMGVAARQRVMEKFSVDNLVDETSRLLRELAEGGRR